MELLMIENIISKPTSLMKYIFKLHCNISLHIFTSMFSFSCIFIQIKNTTQKAVMRYHEKQGFLKGCPCRENQTACFCHCVCYMEKPHGSRSYPAYPGQGQDLDL